MDEKFDILAWWQVNSPRYIVLSRISRHVLAILVSTVALESAFSTAGHVLDPFRSSLSPFMVEALICGQNWLHSLLALISLRDVMDDVEKFEKLDGGMTIIFYIKKNMNVYFFLYLKYIYIYIYMNVLDSWHIYCFIVYSACLFLSLLKKN